jgi:hypothetical protein
VWTLSKSPPRYPRAAAGVNQPLGASYIPDMFSAMFGPPSEPPGAFASQSLWEDKRNRYIPIGEGGRYRLDKDRSCYIGRGASALVFRGEDREAPRGQRAVAIKEPPRHRTPLSPCGAAPPRASAQRRHALRCTRHSPTLFPGQVIDTGRLNQSALQREIELVQSVPKHRNLVSFQHTEQARDSPPQNAPHIQKV